MIGENPSVEHIGVTQEQAALTTAAGAVSRRRVAIVGSDGKIERGEMGGLGDCRLPGIEFSQLIVG